MHFVPLAFDTSCVLPNYDALPDATPNRFYAFGVVARLALLAAALELERGVASAPLVNQALNA
jgi:glutamate--cysteine ligase